MDSFLKTIRVLLASVMVYIYVVSPTPFTAACVCCCILTFFMNKGR